MKSLVADIDQLYAWMTFGTGLDGSLRHLCWAMPGKREDRWLARINVIRRAANSFEQPVDAPPGKRMTLKFKEHIEEALSKAADDNEIKPAKK